MNAPDLPSHRSAGRASAPRRLRLAPQAAALWGFALRRALPRAAFAVALASCTLTDDGFEPVLSEAESAQPAVELGDDPEAEAAPPEGDGCTASLACPEGFECVGDVCSPIQCDAEEDVGACVIDVCVGDDCASGCRDGAQGGGETGIDCGGPCAPCPENLGCTSDDECEPGRCVEGRCAEPSCDDGARNQDETGPDCGGSTCARCAVSASCEADSDCEDGLFCAPMTSACAPVSCQDGSQNGGERGVDCGGGVCPGCEAGTACDIPGDCASGSCVDGACAEPSCDDAVRNGDESDVDCGGGCGPCGTGLGCSVPADCTSEVCGDDCGPDVAPCCQAPSCDDDVQNGNETATDCGAAPCGRCGVGAPCTLGAQCVSNVCASGVCSELCDDGVRNGNESAADCGGSEAGCPRCDDGEACAANADCASGTCDDVCVSCTDGFENGDEGGVDCGGSEPGCPACPRCNADGSTDLGGVGLISTVAGDACARITAFPGYPPTLIDSYEDGTFPLSFSYRQECSGVAGTAQFEAPFDRVTIAGLNTQCPVIFDFAGTAPFQVRWF